MIPRPRPLPSPPTRLRDLALTAAVMLAGCFVLYGLFVVTP